MNKFALTAATLLISGICHAQSANPPVGGIRGDVDLNHPIDNARRNIMTDTLKRQYTHDELQRFREIADSFDRAKSGVYAEAAKVVRRRIAVGISPDSPVEQIRLNAENAGSIVFTDALGQPWNVIDAIVPSYLIVTHVKNMLVLRPNHQAINDTQAFSTRFAGGSIMVLLEGLNSTIPFEVSYGNSRVVDAQIEAQIQARNPLSLTSMHAADLIESDPDAELFLDGEPPKKAKEIKTSNNRAKSWLLGKSLYIRTDLPLHSPAFQLGASSASGMSVYRFENAPPVINAIVDGEIVSVSIGD